MAAQHTPGPWHVEGFTNVIAGELPVALCRTVQGGAHAEQAYHEQLANARLIAAAPELLAALVDLLDATSAYTSLTEERKRMPAILEAVRIAVEKARGE